MVEVRLNQIRKSRFARLMFVVLPLTLGAAAVALADHQTAITSKPMTEFAASPSPAQTSDTAVMVNGKPVPVDSNGNADVNLPNGGGKVEVSGGATTATYDSGQPKIGANQSSNSVNVSVDSNSAPMSGNGFSSSSTHVSGGSFNRSSYSSSFSSTNVFSTSSSNVIANTH